MKTNAKITIKEDTISEYFDYIYNTLHQTTEKEIKKMARLMVGHEGEEDGYIAPRMSTEFNPNLYISGQEEEYWQILSNGEITTLEAIYTGMRLPHSPDSKVWFEFGDKEMGIIERDYAFYQETGVDKWATPSGARHKYAIERGVYMSGRELLDHSTKYLESIIKRGGGDIPPKLI